MFNTKKKRAILVLIVIFLLIMVSFLYYQVNSLYHIGIPCIFYEITGFYCPGCGITRAIFSLMEFDLKASLHNHFLFVVSLPFVVYYTFIRIKDWINFKENYRKEIPSCYLYLILSIVILFGILRNIDLFSFLAPIS
ncbi:MAG: DUF2752 domain-containing protein [Firmicutes bacterium]|nr:DUF2752 domain-containing protein [Bacillota bacterium]